MVPWIRQSQVNKKIHFQKRIQGDENYYLVKGTDYYVVTLFFVLSLVFVWPILKGIYMHGILDWDQHFFYHAVPRATILEHYQFPLWNPYHCGGNVLLANPQSSFLSPTFIFVLLFDVIPGLKVRILIQYIIGMYGMYILSRSLGMTTNGSLLSSSVFMLNGAYASNIVVGHTTFLPVVYIPWAFHYLLRGIEDIKYIPLSSMVLSIMIFEGGVYPFVFTCLFMGAFSFFKALQLKKIAPAGAFVFLLFLTFLLASIKLLPLIEFTSKNPLSREVGKGYTIDILLNALANPDLNTVDFHLKVSEDQASYWIEYFAYVGALPLILSIFGACVMLNSRWPLLLTTVLFLILSFGSNETFDLWDFIHPLPILSSFHVPSRCMMMVVFSLALYSGWALSWLEGYGTHMLVTWGVLIFVIIDLVLVNGPLYELGFIRYPPAILGRRSDTLIQWMGWGHYEYFLMNKGLVNCYERIHLPIRALPYQDEQYKGEVYYNGSIGRPEVISITPNELRYRVSVDRPTRLVVNQNYDPGWYSTGHDVVSHDGLISIDLDPNDEIVTLSYLPRSFLLGQLLSFLGLVFAALVYYDKLPNGRLLKKPT